MKDGIYKDLSIEDYHNNDTHISSTLLRKAKRSLKEFDWNKRGLIEQEKKLHFDFGNAFEIALCEGIDNIGKHVYLYDEEERPEKDKGITSKVNQAWKKQIMSSDMLILPKQGKESLQTLVDMVDSCMRDKTIVSFLEKRQYQTSCFWTDKETGLKLKARPDIIQSHRSIVVDIKTALDGSPNKFSKDAANHDYYTQAIMQIDGVISSGLMDRVDNYFYLVVEKTPPYNATIYEIDPEDLAWMNDAYEWLKNKVSRAIESGEYKGYNYDSDNKYGIMKLDIPLYYKSTF